MTQKEKILGFMKENMKIPMSAEEMAVMLSVPKQDMTEFFNIIEELEQEGRIVKTKKKRYATGALLGLVIGKFIGNERGFGFVE
ncbi:MAG: ribonuclease R, partial [Eubacteriales bacterium]